MDLEQLIKKYIEEARVMQIATVKDNKPWVCTVNYASDGDLNLYWMSLRSTRHSQELIQNAAIAGTIVKDPSVVQGIQFEGNAFEVTGSELEKVNEIYEGRYGHKPERLQEAQSRDASVRTYYKIVPTKFVLFDRVTFPDNPRQELEVK